MIQAAKRSEITRNDGTTTALGMGADLQERPAIVERVTGIGTRIASLEGYVSQRCDLRKRARLSSSGREQAAGAS